MLRAISSLWRIAITTLFAYTQVHERSIQVDTLYAHTMLCISLKENAVSRGSNSLSEVGAVMLGYILENKNYWCVKPL